MDTSLEEIYEQHPRLRPEDSDSDELRNLKSHYVWLYSMSPEEREEFDRMEARAERQREIEWLIDSYELNKRIKAEAERFAKEQGFAVRIAMQDAEKAADPEEYREYIETHIGYIRTAKETMQLIDQDQIRIRNEIKDVRRNGTWHERLQAKRRNKQQKKS